MGNLSLFCNNSASLTQVKGLSTLYTKETLFIFQFIAKKFPVEKDKTGRYFM